MTLKTEIMMLTIQLCIIGINYIFKYIAIETFYFKIVIIFHYILGFFYIIYASFVRIRIFVVISGLVDVVSCAQY